MKKRPSRKSVPGRKKAPGKKKGPRASAGSDGLMRSLLDKEHEILQTEEALVESMRRFRDLFEQSPIGIGIYSPKGELLLVNKSYLKIFEYDSFKDIEQQNIFKDLKLNSGQKKDIKAGRVVSFEKEHDFDGKDENHTGGPMTLLVTISPLESTDQVIGYMCQLQDITESKKIAEAQRLAQLGRLLSDMAHEVNNPLMIISGRSELALLEGIQDEKIRDTLDIILEQCFLAKDIIQNLLKYSRVGKVEKGPVDITRNLELIIRILQHHFRMSNVLLKKEIPSGLPRVTGNEKQLQEVFMNIIRNSADAMPSGGEISVRVRSSADFVKIDIKDNGKGMSRKVLSRIFEPFFTTKIQGTGLGLAVCHTIIQEHGGDLTYKSTVGKGTTATILLPVHEK
ncbi:MAG: PAS domain S-box protein [Candidatus Omnitrophica bacterium]|nr:PAS domain S-box protein [Candidatus Omnitrophota bacterium]